MMDYQKELWAYTGGRGRLLVKSAGYEFHVWTVDKLEESLKAFERGAQTVTTNCAKKQLDEYTAKCKAK